MPTFLYSERELRWFSAPKLPINSATYAKLRSWLFDKGSLTAKLIELSEGNFRVEVLRQIRARASLSEALALKIAPCELCVVREVMLLGHDDAWVFARSVLPLSSLTGTLRHLRKQGNRPLGAFLFSQPQLSRSAIVVAAIDRRHHYVPLNLLGEESLWGRRSVFYLHAKPLLVSEVFLPSFSQALNTNLVLSTNRNNAPSLNNGTSQ